MHFNVASFAGSCFCVNIKKMCAFKLIKTPYSNFLVEIDMVHEMDYCSSVILSGAGATCGFSELRSTIWHLPMYQQSESLSLYGLSFIECFQLETAVASRTGKLQVSPRCRPYASDGSTCGCWLMVIAHVNFCELQVSRVSLNWNIFELRNASAFTTFSSQVE